MLLVACRSAAPGAGYRSEDLDRLDSKRQEADKHNKTGELPTVKTVTIDPLRPPDLIIQDELHLISGPLGTVTGLYETAIDHLCRDRQGRGPKIVSSTATVRRAQEQIRALFGRTSVQIFPPPGPNRRDSFFARTVTTRESARLYLGIAAQGRSASGSCSRPTWP